MTILFTKAQAVGNDFLIVDGSRLIEQSVPESDWPDLARRMCDRQHGIGADGLEILSTPGEGVDASIRVFNSDGSEAEISGNGTRCVAAYLAANRNAAQQLQIRTKVGIKELRLIEQRGTTFIFEMNMGRPRYHGKEVGCELRTGSGPQTVTIVDVGNPQCALQVDDFAFDWRAVGRELETHPKFPQRTNVSFFRVIDRHTIEVRFWERGAGETLSSGTGSTGAAVAAILLGQTDSPVRVQTPGGEIEVAWRDEVTSQGPAVIIARGEYFN